MNDRQLEQGVWNVISNSHVIKSLSAHYDFIIVDLEHGFRDFKELESQLIFLMASNSKVYVRVRNFSDLMIQSLLDMGVTRFLVPQIRRLNEIHEFISKVTYPPYGTRGFHPRTLTNLSHSDTSILVDGKDAIEVYPLIETKESLDLVKEIVEIEQVAGVYFGVYDLSLEIANGDKGSPKIQAALKSVTEILRVQKKVLIYLTDTSTQIESLHESVSVRVVRGIDSEIITRSIKLNSGR